MNLPNSTRGTATLESNGQNPTLHSTQLPSHTRATPVMGDAGADIGVTSSREERICYTEGVLRELRLMHKDEAREGDIRSETSTEPQIWRSKTTELKKMQEREVGPKKQATKNRASLKTKKLQGERPNCFQCFERPAFWGLDFCGNCLLAEASKWQVKFEEGDALPMRENKKGNRVLLPRPKYRPLQEAEVRALQSLPPDTRSFCVGNRVSIGIMQVMLARLYRQSHNPLIREHDPGRNNPYDSRSISPEAYHSDVKLYDNSNLSNLPQGQDVASTLSPQEHGRPFAKTTWNLGEDSPNRDGQSGGSGSKGERKNSLGRLQREQIEAGRAKEKRKGNWESDYGKDISPSGVSSKKARLDTGVEAMERDDHDIAHQRSSTVRTSTEAHHKPNDDEWAMGVLEEILHMEMAARPATPLEVGSAVRKELEKQLVADIMFGDPNQGRPIYIPLLRALNTVLESWEAVALA